MLSAVDADGVAVAAGQKPRQGPEVSSGQILVDVAGPVVIVRQMSLRKEAGVSDTTVRDKQHDASQSSTTLSAATISCESGMTRWLH